MKRVVAILLILMLLFSLARSCVRLHFGHMVTQQLQYSIFRSSGDHRLRRAEVSLAVNYTQV